MPTYLCHGFRWQRRSVRVYVVVQNLDDASPEWIIPAKSATCILESFYNLFDFLPYCSPVGHGFSESDEDESSLVIQTTGPVAAGTGMGGGSGGTRSQSRSRSQSVTAPSQRSRSQSQSQSHRSRSRGRHTSQSQRSQQGINDIHGGTSDADFRAQDWSVIKVLEEYDPLNLSEVSRPYAYVADYAIRVDLSVSIAEEMQRYEERVKADRDPPMMGHGSDETGRKKGNKRTGWFEKLRDQLQRGEDIRWYVVVNGDEVRDWPDEPERRQEADKRPTATNAQRQHHAQYTHQQHIFEGKDDRHRKEPQVQSRPPRVAGRPVVPEKDLPAVRPQMSMDMGKGRPKTPKGGLRRLFGRSREDSL
ncbi:hypothetical protein QBC47DRAFT_107688 [Echria macrotheca]|uniref:Developmental regulator n=1 Tax=Echria macrotheca TaxID=438768 RepID=A0AAJ0BK88_9PEZI|nr:hypothetical protein QBC47DRAFT_107688 [Echria macrotheca]